MLDLGALSRSVGSGGVSLSRGVSVSRGGGDMGSRSSVRDCVLVASLALGALGLRSGVQAAALDGAAEQRVRSATLEVVAENGGFPFNSTAFTNNGTSIIRAIAKGTPGDAKVRYALPALVQAAGTLEPR